ncbi:MAG: 2-dehydropantoate 2-reductase [Betaproteobacteria bacterium]
MRIAVIGAGGVGGYFGGRLAQAGNDVVFVARGRHLAALRERGLLLESGLGNASIRNATFTDDVSQVAPCDAVMLCVKLWDVETSALAIAPLVATGGVVIPFQNGVEAPEILQRVLGPERVIGGVAYIAATIRELGVIAHTGTMARLVVGPFDAVETIPPTGRDALPPPVGASALGRPGHAAAHGAMAFRDACVAANIDAELSVDIRRALWDKFCFLAAMSGVTAMARQPIGVVRADPDLRAALEAAMREAWTLGRTRGVPLAGDYVARQMTFTDGLPAVMRSSMLNDLVAGNRLEAPWLSGAVARMAVESGTAAPVSATFFAAMKPFLAGAA